MSDELEQVGSPCSFPSEQLCMVVSFPSCDTGLYVELLNAWGGHEVNMYVNCDAWL